MKIPISIILILVGLPFAIFAQDSSATESANVIPASNSGGFIENKLLSEVLNGDWLKELEEAYNFAEKFDKVINPVNAFDIHMQYLEEKRGILIWKFDNNQPVFSIRLDLMDKGIKVSHYALSPEARVIMVKSIETLAARGILNVNLADFHFTAEDLKLARLTIRKLKVMGFTAFEIHDAGFELGEVNQLYSASSLRLAGYTASDFKELGYNYTGLRAVGFSVEELTEAGIEWGVPVK